MKRLLFIAALAAIPAFAADVGVSVTIGEPGFYGRIDIGNFPQPRVVYRQPVLVERVVVERPPIYLRVPPGHAKHWAKHCRKYDACGERVYFVRDEWYTREYVPHYRVYQREDRGDRRDERSDERRHDRGNDHRGDERGRGRER